MRKFPLVLAALFFKSTKTTADFENRLKKNAHTRAGAL
jgi:hypothetical protein